MASYNYSKYLPEAIESVINQTYENWELIIVDDCSNDNSVEIAESYVVKDSRIMLLKNDRNLGLAKTLKRAIKASSGNWIAFLESDDIFLPVSLEKKADYINSGADIIYTDVELFGDEAKIKGLFI